MPCRRASRNTCSLSGPSLATGFRVRPARHASCPSGCRRAQVVGAGGRLPDLPALVPGLGRRRLRRPRGHRRRAWTTSSDLGVDALWMSPIYPSPDVDWGYDVSDYSGIDPDFGTLDDFDALVARRARARAEGPPRPRAQPHVDRAPVVPRAPRRYVWARRRSRTTGSRSFGGIAWTPRRGDGPLLPALVLPGAARPRLAATRTSARRSATRCGSGSSAAPTASASTRSTRICKDPRAARRPARDRAVRCCRCPTELRQRSGTSTRGTTRTSRSALAVLREAAGDAMLVGEVFVPTAGWRPICGTSTCAFAFELMFARWDPDGIAPDPRRGLARPRLDALQPRLLAGGLTRWASENVRLAAALTLTLPGTAFVYQGDEIGLRRRPGRRPAVRPPRPRLRTATRCSGTPGPLGGFTTGDAVARRRSTRSSATSPTSAATPARC